MKFCKVCGVNLYAVMQVVATKEPEEKFDWNKTWVTEMFLSASEKKRRKEELERTRGITPEMKRYTEIKAGVIVSSLGIALGILLFVLMGGIIAGGQLSPEDVEIVSRLWVLGVIPLFVGLALITNGLVVSKKLVEAAKRNTLTGEIAEADSKSLLTGEISPPVQPFSVTEQTTQHLGRPGQK
ncbi:MAG TPA: hypothetical protein VJV03_12765 [Pyrinomonadaceae bacterium]|nr:hypothetical protein [Pyrinomonadaceae bacterium]